MTDRDDIELRTWASRAFADEPAAGSVGDTIGDDLARAHAGLTRRRRWTAGASGVAIAAIIGALVAAPEGWQSAFDGSEVAGQPAPTPPSGRRVPMDLEPLAPAEAEELLEDCVAGGDPSRLRVVYAWRIAGPDWVDWTPPNAAVVALDEAAGRTWACQGTAASDNGELEEPQPVHLFGASGGSPCPSPRYRVRNSYFARVSHDVHHVEIRFGPVDRPGPWWVSRAHDGYLFFGYWFDLPRDVDEAYRVQAMAYDVDGNPIESDELIEQVNKLLTPQMIKRCQTPMPWG